MSRTLIATGHFTWNSVERRSDRYGSVRLNERYTPQENPFADNDEGDVLVDPSLCEQLEGRKGKLIAEVLEPVESPHMGDLARGLFPSTPKLGEIVLLGEGTLFFEHFDNTIPHEISQQEREDKQMTDAIQAQVIAGLQSVASRLGGKVKVNVTPKQQPSEPPEKYDLIGLKPDDGRERDWLDPRAFYRLHLSKINLFFEESE